MTQKKGNILKGENKFQSSCCQLLDLTKLLYFSIPNGTNKESWLTQWLFKVTGLKAGAPDLFIAEPVPMPGTITGWYRGVFIECKFGKNTTSDEQELFIKALRDRGYYVAVIWKIDELITILQTLYPFYTKHLKF